MNFPVQEDSADSPTVANSRDLLRPPELRQTVRLILQRFDKSESDEQRADIARELESLGPDGLNAAEQLIRFPLGRTRSQLLFMLILVAAYGGLISVISTLFNAPFGRTFVDVMYIASIAAILYATTRRFFSRDLHLTSEIFGWLHDKRSLPAMFQLFGWYGPTGAPRRGLTRLLLQLGSADRSLLHPRQAKQLSDILHQYTVYAYAANQEQTDFCIAALHAMQYVGTAASLPTLKSFAEMEVEACGGNPLWRANAERIKAQAEASLQTLTQMLDQESNTSPLLRPSAAPVDEQNLLRPAGNFASPEHLVRPASVEIEEQAR